LKIVKHPQEGKNNFQAHNEGMTSLRTVLAQNMKAQRQILEISQAQLAERVNTSTNYIAQIETEKRFPTPEMLERIAGALEIDPPALFTTEIRPVTEAEILAKVQKQIMCDVSRAISVSFKKFEVESP
jgi:transcriptional regulator with XRE-family HTH domain